MSKEYSQLQACTRYHNWTCTWSVKYKLTLQTLRTLKSKYVMAYKIVVKAF